MNRFKSNIARVRNFVDLYEERMTQRGRKGRAKTQDTDLLRGAVVLLHATFEDLARTALEASWNTEPERLVEVLRFPQAKSNARDSETIAGLLRHRGRTIDDLLHESFEHYLDRASFNNQKEVSGMLARCGLEAAKFGPVLGELDVLAKRRHAIVHRADRNPDAGQGSYKASSINKDRVRKWIGAVETFYQKLMAVLDPKEAELLEQLLGER